MKRILCGTLPFIFLMALTTCAVAATLPQSAIDPTTAPKASFPRIVLYSVSWCPHCKEAKEYLTSHNIPFINKDVELDEQFMTELSQTYKSTGVPVIVIGSDQKVLKGFKPEEFEKALREIRTH